ncbi:MAG: tRNA (N6-isopentenyl adenosine(37)-C2)-methylthiotransferase MiaB [Candidatus Dadabacteria bacterium]|nr:MAG: tRNA (N6-isopentenyl adenosine(37)-C2)-methylthiotransferase MiaB [Candidatus Dadabacteria bacterium]
MDSPRFYIQTFGCQMNDHDSAVLARMLEEAGYLEVADPGEADVILLNTCAIREKAEQKLYSQLGRFRPLKERRPEVVIAVGGCVAQEAGRRVVQRAPYVDLVFGTHALHQVPDLVEAVRRTGRRLVVTPDEADPDRIEAFYAYHRARTVTAYVTVMQGCDNYCAYCIVPYVRGRERSRPVREIVAEVERLARAGVVEVTLLGQNVNSYGVNPKQETDFAGLIRRVAEVEGIRRIRFTTSHPKDLSDDLIRCFAEVPQLMPHIHLPVQSGSDRILEAMRRRYTVARYLDLVERLRRARPGIAITSDMIVGFPGETETDFEATLALMERVRFDGLFSFKFSPRPGTLAARLPDPVPEPVKEERLARLQRLQQAHTLERNQALVGHVRPVLVEGPSKAGGGQVAGRTPENKIVNFAGDLAWTGTEVPVRITAAAVNSLRGEAVPEESAGRVTALGG